MVASSQRSTPKDHLKHNKQNSKAKFLEWTEWRKVAFSILNPMLTAFQQFGVWDNIEKGEGKLTITNCFKVCGWDCS